jgi:hypothetical protein
LTIHLGAGEDLPSSLFEVVSIRLGDLSVVHYPSVGGVDRHQSLREREKDTAEFIIKFSLVYAMHIVITPISHSIPPIYVNAII